jgi:hypothetical protein
MKAGSIIVVIVGIVIFAIMFPLVMDSITGAATESQSDLFEDEVVADGSATVTLTLDLYKARTASVSSMTATGSGADPVASSYVEETKALTITGLGVDTPQDITVVYLYDRTEDFTGLSEFMELTPLLLWLGVIFVLLGGAFLAVKARGLA